MIRVLSYITHKNFQAVIFVEGRAVYGLIGKSVSAPTRINHLLILNLAVADLIMGIYLLMLGIIGTKYDGDFCRHELQWRSSITCEVMGVLVMISSETSVITMVTLTCFRAFAVFKVNLASHVFGVVNISCERMHLCIANICKYH